MKSTANGFPGAIPNWSAFRSGATELPTVALLVVALARLLGALMWNIRAVGVEYIPTEGPVVFASNHMSIADAHAIAFFVNRPPIHYVTG